MSVKTRRTAVVAGVSAFALFLSACGSSSPSSDSSSSAPSSGSSSASSAATGSESSASETEGPVNADSGWCDKVKENFGDLNGKTVGVYTTITGTEADAYRKAYADFTTCTGATVAVRGLEGLRGPGAGPDPVR